MNTSKKITTDKNLNFLGPYHEYEIDCHGNSKHLQDQPPPVILERNIILMVSRNHDTKKRPYQRVK